MANNPFQNSYGNRYQNSFFENIKAFVKNPSWLNRLIVINAGVFIFFWLLRIVMRIIGFLFQSQAVNYVDLFVRWLSCPADFTTLLHRPWSIFTALFIHANFWHLFFNMVMFYVIGRIFLEYMNEKHLLLVYFLGGIFGNLVYMAAYNIFPAFSGIVPVSYAVGASGSVMAVMAAITAYRPRHEINFLLVGRISLVALAICFIIADIISIPRGNAGGHFAHIGGFLFGLAYIASLKKRVDSYQTRKRDENAGRKAKYYVSKESGRPLSDEEYNARKHEEKMRIDAILDKISKYGYDALTAEEKDFLFHYSNK